MIHLILANSLRGFLHLIRKDSITHKHGLAVYVKEGLPFAAWELTLENSVDSYFCFRLALLLVSLVCLPLSITFFTIMQFLILYHLT